MSPHAAGRATGLRNLSLHDAAQNQIWLEIVQFALDLPAWMPLLALAGRARLPLFSVAARLVTSECRRILRLAQHWPFTRVITDALDRLVGLCWVVS